MTLDFLKRRKKHNIIRVTPVLMLDGKVVTANPKHTVAKNFISYISHYCNTSTIHGVKYLSESGRYLIEKFVWLCIIVLVCLLCLLLVSKSFHKWRVSPIIVSLESQETSIFTIPFPAVTVCPEVKMDPDYFNFTYHFINKINKMSTTEREDEQFDCSMMICSIAQTYAELLGIEFTRKFVRNRTLYELYINTPLGYIDNLTTFHFMGKRIRMYPVLTEEGLCYNFNMLQYYEIIHNRNFSIPKKRPKSKTLKWSLEEGYPINDDNDDYPKRTFLSGFNGGLVIHGLYTNHTKIDYLCEQSVHGFKIALHHPSELPNMDKSLRLPLDQAVFVAVKPRMITFSKELTHYDIKDRRCYLPGEKYLSIFKFYSQQNCLSECLYNFTKQNCGCVLLWVLFPIDTPICGPSKTNCIKESKVIYLKTKVAEEQCKCLPACTSLSYDIETSQTAWNWPEYFRSYKVLNTSNPICDPKLSHFSKLVVYYKDLQFLASKRHEVYGTNEFFSNVGGLLALFIGFSVISAIEIIHFLTMRIVYNIIKYGKKLWYGGER